jgi:hypothetical protein
VNTLEELHGSLAVRRPADGATWAAVAVAAVMTDVAVRSSPDGLAGTLLVALVAAGLLASGRVANPQARAVAGSAVVFGAFLSARTSPWLIPFDVLAIAGLLVLAASFAGGGSIPALTLPGAVAQQTRPLAILTFAPARTSRMPVSRSTPARASGGTSRIRGPAPMRWMPAR